MPLDGFMHRAADWVSTYYSALSVLAAFAAVIVALIAAIISLLSAHQTREDLQYARYRAVYAWTQHVKNPDPGEAPWKLIVRNDTRHPISDWTCVVRRANASDADRQHTVSSTSEGLALPGDFQYTFVADNVDMLSWKETEVRTELTFRDARGQKWRRSTDGELKRLQEM